MSKVNIGLRGWRFDEEAVFDEDGRVRPLGAMPEATRRRVLRLTERLGDPCDACWLTVGQEDPERCRPADAIYGEVGSEVVVCRRHEDDFVYWFREVEGTDLAGRSDFADAFHAWFHDGNRAPDDYEGIEHVDEDPESVPEPPDPEEAMPGIEAEIERFDDEDLAALDVDLDDLDV